MKNHTESSDERSAQEETHTRIERLKSGVSKTASFAKQKTADMGDAVSSATSGDVLLKSFETALKGSDLLAKQQVERMQLKHPHLTVTQQLTKLNTRFLSEVTAVGAATGASAAAPGFGAIAALGISAGDFMAFLTAASVHVQSVARVLDVEIEDADHARFLVLTVLLGGSGSSTVQKIAERTGAHWGRKFVKAVPASTLKQINKVMGQHFITRYGTRQGVLVLGKIAPFGFGVVLGAGGNHLLGQTTVKATQKTFQEFLPDDVEVEEKGTLRMSALTSRFKKNSPTEETVE